MAISEVYDSRQGGQYEEVHRLARQLKTRTADKK